MELLEWYLKWMDSNEDRLSQVKYILCNDENKKKLIDAEPLLKNKIISDSEDSILEVSKDEIFVIYNLTT